MTDDAEVEEDHSRATTDAQGAFEFRGVQAGEYVFDVVGPWKVIFGGTFFVQASVESWHPVNHPRRVPGRRVSPRPPTSPRRA